MTSLFPKSFVLVFKSYVFLVTDQPKSDFFPIDLHCKFKAREMKGDDEK